MNRILILGALLLTIACASPQKTGDSTPSWYNQPKQNNAENLFGVAEGNTLEEATRYALADAAARLMVSISSESNLLREENQTSTNEELRQSVRQNIEKIDFSNFEVTKSDKIDQKFFAEVKIERSSFLNEQKDRFDILNKKISDLEKNSATKNTIQKRNDLIKILSLGKELELRGRILSGAGVNVNLKEKLNHLADLENQFNKTTSKIEFFFDNSAPKEIAQIIRSALNKEKITIASSLSNSNPNQIILKIKSQNKNNKIYEAFITKLEVDFENSVDGKILASNKIEVTGSSSIDVKESYSAALNSLTEKISQDGILKILGILN